jgi:hypothetical protein
MTVTGKRVLLLAAAVLLTLSALLAVAILLFGRFGETEGRILGTTALLAAFSVAALPGAILFDRRRLPLLAGLVLGLAVAGGTLALAAVWTDDPPDALGKAIGTAVVFLLAVDQTAMLALRRTEADTRPVRSLFAVSTVLGLTVAAMVTVALWAETEESAFLRGLGALVVLDLLGATLQPILARARPIARTHRLSVGLEGGETVELELEAPDLAEAAARAIRTVEHDGRRAVRIDLAEPDTRQEHGPLLR